MIHCHCRDTCCVYKNELYPVDVLIDTVVAEDNCTSVISQIKCGSFYFNTWYISRLIWSARRILKGSR